MRPTVAAAGRAAMAVWDPRITSVLDVWRGLCLVAAQLGLATALQVSILTELRVWPVIATALLVRARVRVCARHARGTPRLSDQFRPREPVTRHTGAYQTLVQSATAPV
jgi:hypothetical protein